MPVNATRRLFCFGPFEADEGEGELRKHGVRIKLHAQPFQVLLMLLERPSEVVTREEMRQRLWGEGTFVDFDHGLNSAVNKIREALNDSASRPRYLETLPGKGYRFIGPVTLKGQATVEQPASVAATAPAAVLTAPHELPVAPRKVVRTLLLLVQAMYLAFYLAALANLPQIHDIFLAANLLAPTALMSLLVTSAAVLIPVRLYIFAAVAFGVTQLPAKFGRIFPGLLLFDLLWALSPFLLVPHVNTGLALAISAPLVYLPFAQRSLVLMFARGG